MPVIKKKDDKGTQYVTNMADLLQIIHDTKKVMVERHGPEEGIKAFERLKAKDVLDHYALDAGETLH